MAQTDAPRSESEVPAQALADVAILGLGPVGCFAAILLARRGLRVLAVERDEAVYKLPRAVNLDGEVVRSVQPFGLAEELNSLLQPLRPGERAGFANSRREFLFGAESRDFGANGWQPMNMFDQPELEAYLRDTALDQDNVTAYIGFEATEFCDHGDRVSLSVAPAKQPAADTEADAGVLTAADTETEAEAETETATPKTLEARYLIACDGASSFTRKTLGIGWHDLGYNHDWLVVDITTLPGHTLGTTTMQVCDPDRISTYVCTKDPYRRWEFKLNKGETWEEMLDPERIRSLIEAWTPAGTYEIRRAAMYQFHAATADTWRVGNVFIAGDAAHQTPPFLGQGMNAGVRDVINLGWKLPLVRSGLLEERFLDSYQAERDAHAHDLVEWAVSIGRLMEHLAAVEAAERAGEAPPETPPALKAAGYGQGRGQPPLRAGALMTEQVREDGPVGFLFAQPIVRDGAREVRLDEVLGPGFAVVGLTAEDLKLSPESERLLDRLGARRVVLDGLAEARGHFDRGYLETPVMIIRPDRIVFGVTTATVDLDSLVKALGERLCLRDFC
ncbi:MAG: bifunctional 3-(3-hydroxy-phenyl)propionate/3-hydroxycinnamic acid hydroxylase [Pseudomonadota bacterium]